LLFKRKNRTENIEVKEAEAKKRNLEGSYKKVAATVAIAFSLFQIYANSFSTMPTTIMCGYHLAFLLALTFLMYPSGKGSPKNKFSKL
jgi:TRAP-type uncharacterized transport system fused permease subunit